MGLHADVDIFCIADDHVVVVGDGAVVVNVDFPVDVEARNA